MGASMRLRIFWACADNISAPSVLLFSIFRTRSVLFPQPPLPCQILLRFVFRRELARNQTHLVKKSLVKNTSNVTSCVVPMSNRSKNRAGSPAASQISLLPLYWHNLAPTRQPKRWQCQLPLFTPFPPPFLPTTV